jgi:hypothetical protein
MKFDPGSKAAFVDYEASLQLLEEAFNKAGMQIEFACAIAPSDQKYVHILFNGRTNNKQSIEGDSPACAIKDVAKAVRL